ncbi:porin [Shigella flexneri]
MGSANKAQNFEAVAQYQFHFGLRPSWLTCSLKVKTWGSWLRRRRYPEIC